MSEDPIRVGLIGAGTNTTERHIPGLQALDGVELVSVCNRSRASSQRVAQQFGIPKIYDRWWELVTAPDTDAILIGTWPYLHCPATLAALAADKHVLVEARMAMNAVEARQMLAAARARPHLVTQIVPSPFSFWADATIKRLIGEGYLGNLVAIEVWEHSGSFVDPEAPLHWRQNSDLSGLNVMGLGIWYETLMRWVGEATSVIAQGKTFVTMRRNPETNEMHAVQIPEHLTIVADMACGAQATFSLSSVTGLMPALEMRLFGSRGTLRFTADKLYGGQQGDESLQEIVVPKQERGRWRVEEEFINAIHGRETIRLTPFETGVKYMEFTEAVARSMAQGRAIPLP